MGIGTVISLGSLLGGGALAVPPIIDAVDEFQRWPTKRRNEINNMSDEEFKQFQPKFIDQYLGVKSKKNSATLRNEHLKKEAFGNPKVQDRKALIENNGGTFVYKPGFTANDTINANASEYLKAQQKQRQKLTFEAGENDFESKGNRYLRNLKRKELFESRRFNTETLLAQERARLDSLDFQRSRDRRDDMRYNEELDRLDRKDRRAAISNATAGLVALAAAFAA